MSVYITGASKYMVEEMQTNTTQSKPGPKDVFLHLLAMLLFYASVINFLVLVFQTLNLWFPDPAFDVYYADFSHSTIKWAIASLVVMFPIYIVLTRYLRKIYFHDELRGKMRVRKWLTYFTLFAAAIAFIVTLIILIFQTLEGQLTLRTGLKILSVFIVATLSFEYYYYELKNKTGYAVQLIVWASIVLIVCAIVAGFIFGGTPGKGRNIRFDQQRAENLHQIQFAVYEYWLEKDDLPASLPELKSEFSYLVISDPEFENPYEYSIVGQQEYQVCAVFSQSNLENQGRDYTGLTWHEGRNCYQSTPVQEKNEMYGPVRRLKPVN